MKMRRVEAKSLLRGGVGKLKRVFRRANVVGHQLPSSHDVRSALSATLLESTPFLEWVDGPKTFVGGPSGGFDALA